MIGTLLAVAVIVFVMWPVSFWLIHREFDKTAKQFKFGKYARRS